MFSNSQKEYLKNKYKVFSFDLFDTLVYRKLLNPKDIFLLVERKLNSKYKTNHKFHSDRVSAESIARQQINDLKQDITINDIYNEFIDFGYSQEEIDFLQDTEIEVELEFVEANPELLEYFNDLKQSGKKILICSDMYLSDVVLEKILKKCGFNGYEKILVSSVEKKSKHIGNMFQVVLDFAKKEFGTTSIVHIGDNFQSDISNAKSYSIDAFYYPKKVESVEKEHKYTQQLLVSGKKSKLSKSLLLSRFWKSRIRESDNYFELFGYYVFGPLILGFIKWLKIQADLLGINRLYFSLREGDFLKQIYDKYYSGYVTETLAISRRVVNFASIEAMSDKDLKFLCSTDGIMNFEEYFSRLNIPLSVVVGLDKYVGKKVVTQSDKNVLIKIINENISLIERYAKEERVAYIKYLSRLGVLSSNSKIIVDVGWHGSMLSSLRKISNKVAKESALIGMYVGLFPEAKENIGDDKLTCGFLTNLDGGVGYKIIRECVEIFEDVLMPQYGTVIQVKENDSRSEIIKQQLVEGEAKQLELVKLIQSGITKFVVEWKELEERYGELQIDKNLALLNLSSVLLNPQKIDIANLGNFVHIEGIGGSNSMKSYVSSNTNLFEGYKSSFWRRGFYLKQGILQKCVLYILKLFGQRGRFYD